MVDISQETTEETASRLARVIRDAKLKTYQDTYVFLQFPHQDFPAAIRSDALAIVRDDEIWSQLIPSDDPAEEGFALFRVHFPHSADNSGFVGWLASHLKTRFGTGVFVICGCNRDEGGIFDYWGVPAQIAQAVFAEVERLVASEGMP